MGVERTGKQRHKFHLVITSMSHLRSNFIFCLPAAESQALAEKKIYIAEISMNSKAKTATKYLRELNTERAETTKRACILS